MNRQALKEELARDEGVKLTAYKDSLGYWTIGIGHLLGTSPRMSTITLDEAFALLDVDIEQAIALAKEVVPELDAIADDRQRAIVNMAFNRGQHFKNSTKILPAIRKGIDTNDWSAVSAAIAGSQWASQVGDRATRLGEMLENPKA